MDFGKLFSRAWELCWQNKFLFALGFLAALGSGGGGSSGAQQSNFSFSGGELPPGWEQNIERFFNEIAAIGAALLITLGCVAFLVGIILWLVRLTSQAGLISAASRLDAGESLGFATAFRSGTGYLGRMVGLNLLLYFPVILLGLTAAVIGIAVAASAIAAGTSGAAGDAEAIFGVFGFFGLCICLLACILVPLYLLIGVIYPFAQREIVLAGRGVVASIRHAWEIVRANAGEVLLLILFFLVLGFLSGLATALVMVPIAVLSFGPAVIDLINGAGPTAADILFLIFGGLLMAVAAALVNTLLVTYRSVTVTLAYEQFVGAKGKLAL